MNDDIFDDYYDEDGNLHIDARKPHKKSVVKNLKVNLSDIKNLEQTDTKLIIHHCNLVD